MVLWTIAQWVAWIVSAVIFLWMLADMIRVNRSYSEDVLMSSREGVDDLFGDAGKGGH